MRFSASAYYLGNPLIDLKSEAEIQKIYGSYNLNVVWGGDDSPNEDEPNWHVKDGMGIYYHGDLQTTDRPKGGLKLQESLTYGWELLSSVGFKNRIMIEALSGKKRGGPIQELKPEPVYELSPPAQEHPVKKMLPKPKPQEEFPNLLEAALKEFTR